MAKNRNDARKKPSGKTQQPPPRLAKHLKRLGLGSIKEYRAWCQAYGFAAKLNKTNAEFERERSRARIQDDRDQRVIRRDVTKPMVALELALLHPDELGPDDFTPLGRARARLREYARHRSSCGELLELIRVVHERGRFLLDGEAVQGEALTYLDGLIALNERRGQWLRPLSDWRPSSHNRGKQFSSLARHLMARYPVPVFMDTVWMRRTSRASEQRDLFVHIGRGGNPRTGPTLVPLTKKIAHHFLQAPDHCLVEGAIRWGQVFALGGDHRLAQAIAASPLINDFRNEAFWQSVLRFFVAHPMLDRTQVGPILDFIDHCKFRTEEVVAADGSVQTFPPPQPGFSMARRTPAALLAQMERWHHGLGRGARRGPEIWEASGIGSFRLETGTHGKRTWTIRELRTAKSLELEGRAMQHCVLSYLRSCASGACSIWSMELETPQGIERRQTIEVNRHRAIVQSRGKRNAWPGQKELDILRRWASQERLVLASYL